MSIVRIWSSLLCHTPTNFFLSRETVRKLTCITILITRTCKVANCNCRIPRFKIHVHNYGKIHPSSQLLHTIFAGHWIPYDFVNSDQTMEEIRQFSTRPDDVFIVSFPKSGESTFQFTSGYTHDFIAHCLLVGTRHTSPPTACC